MARSSVRGGARGAQRSRRGRKGQSGAIEFFTRPEQHIVWRVLGFLIRARAELTITAVVLTVWFVASDQFGPNATIIGMTATTLVVFAVPASRRFVVRRAWCVTSRHRMRTCFAQTRTMTHNGRMPFLLWSRPSPIGERVRVWLPAGLEVNDLQRNIPELATACWARETRITISRAQAALVIVDVVRRDPLGTSTALAPTVIEDLDIDDQDDDAIAPLPDRSTVTPPTPTAAPGIPGQNTGQNGNRRDRTDRPVRKPAPAPEEPVVTGINGVDLSDYI
jgi:hypothetical protein